MVKLSGQLGVPSSLHEAGDYQRQTQVQGDYGRFTTALRQLYRNNKLVAMAAQAMAPLCKP